MAENYKRPQNKDDYANKLFKLESELNNTLVDYDNIFGDTFFSDLRLSSRLPRTLDLLRYKIIEKTYSPVFFRIEFSNIIILDHEIQAYSGCEISSDLAQRQLILVKNDHQFCIDFNNCVNDEQSSLNNLCISDESVKYNLVPHFETIKNCLFRSECTFTSVAALKKQIR